MKNNLKTSAVLIGSALLLSSSAVNAANITISDNNIGSSGYVENSSGWYKGGAAFAATAPLDPLIGAKSEYQEVEPGMQTGSVWDLAAFVTPSVGRLGVVSAYNLAGGYGGTQIGDIMVKVGATPNYYGDNNQVYHRYALNTFGFQFAVKMNFGAGTYSVFAVDANTVMENGEYSAERFGGFYNSASQPWRLSTTTNGIAGANLGTTVAGFQNLALTYTNTKTAAAASALTGFSVTADYKYYAEIGTGFVNALANQLQSPNVLYKLTMECGNDNMLGVDTVGLNVNVPDGSATLALLGMGFLSLVGLAKLQGRKTA